MDDEFTIFLQEIEKANEVARVERPSNAAEILVVLAVVAVIIMFGVWLMGA